MVIDLAFIIIIPLLLLFLAGQPIMLALGLVGMVGIYALLGEKFLLAIGSMWWNSTNSYILTAVPLFIFMGELLSHSGIRNAFTTA